MIEPAAWPLALVSLAAFVMLVVISIKTGEKVMIARDRKWLVALQSRLPDPASKKRRKMDTSMRDLTALGGDTFTILVILSGSAILLMRGQVALWLAFVLCIGITRGAGYLLKATFNRSRPDIRDKGMDIFTSSFPSIHTAMNFTSSFSIIFFLVLGGGAPVAALIIAGLMGCLVGWTRLYFAVHWPTDVAAGWFLGLWICSATAAFV